MKKLDAARMKYVMKEEKRIVFGKGGDGPWCDVEADEVDLGKEEVGDGDDSQTKKLRWEQWGGIVQRGEPSSLVLFKTNPELTKLRSPGPGPIRKQDWLPKAKRWLKGRCVFLHTDGARSYMIGVNRKNQLDGVI